MLKGEAKRVYMREYMRQRRAGPNKPAKTRVEVESGVHAAAVDALRKEIAGLKAELAKRPEKPGADAPIAALQKELAAAKQRIVKLTSNLVFMTARMAQVGAMPRETEKAIDMVLHNDQRRNATEADRDEAYKLFNAWRTSTRKATRRRR